MASYVEGAVQSVTRSKALKPKKEKVELPQIRHEPKETTDRANRKVAANELTELKGDQKV